MGDVFRWGILGPGNIAKKLAEHAIRQGSYDNVTVSILFLS